VEWTRSTLSLEFGLFVFFGVAACLELGRRLGLRHLREYEKLRTGAVALEGAVFGLMGLVVAFTFSGATQRWDGRRTLIVQEANAIGTAWLRIDLAPAEVQPELRELFKEYLDSRLAFFRALPAVEPAHAEYARSTALQGRIWSAAVKADLSSPAQMLLLPALNEMIDITSTRAMALETHPPLVIYLLLVGLVLASGVLAGYAGANAQRSSTHLFLFSLAMSVSVFVVIDLEFPRAGFIRIDSADRMLVELRQSMN
jgi:hypothetical protein